MKTSVSPYSVAQTRERHSVKYRQNSVSTTNKESFKRMFCVIFSKENGFNILGANKLRKKFRVI